MFNIIDAEVEDVLEQDADIPEVQIDQTKLTSMESWAHSVKYTQERRGAMNGEKRMPDHHNIGDMFLFEDRVNLMEAWDAIGGNRVSVATRPARSVLMNGDVVDVQGKLWIYPTLDGEEFNPHKPLEVVSSRRYEVINPQEVVALMHDHFRDLDDKPLVVTAIVFSTDMNFCIIQFERPSIEVRTNAHSDLVRRFFTVCIPIMGSVSAGAVDARWFCMNQLPSMVNNSLIRIKHLNGANEVLQKEFAGVVKSLDMGLQVQELLYDQLRKIPVQAGDLDRVLQGTYPYKGLPAGFTQSTDPKTVLNWFASESFKLGMDDDFPKINKKTAELRQLAKKGYEEAVEQVGDNLWALAQINYAANHHMTKGKEALVHDMLIKGWRRHDALHSFTEVLALGAERGVEIPKKIMPMVESVIKEHNRAFEKAEDKINLVKMLKAANDD